MILPDADWQKSRDMLHLLSALDADVGETRFVGGCVRDALLGCQASDVDLATRLHPPAVMARLERAGIKAVPTGLAHGTVTAVLSGRPVEVTTLRRDVSTDGRRATVAFTDDWREDAARRDFTINALSADPGSRTVFDYFAGLEDLEAGRVRFIGDAVQRIAEDHLRILRFFRFHARFGRGDVDGEALQACTNRANDLMALSRERIADELLKLLALADPLPSTQLMVTHAILRPVLPEIDENGVDRLALLLRRERSLGLAPDPLRRLAAVLPADPAAAQAIAARLRLSNKAGKRLACAADRRDALPADARALAYRIGTDEAIDRLLLADAPPDLERNVEALRTWRKPHFPLSGRDLLAMGVAEGPEVSRLLRAIETQWLERGFVDDKAALKALARDHLDQMKR